jgi:hypothetical protein
MNEMREEGKEIRVDLTETAQINPVMASNKLRVCSRDGKWG